MLTARSALALQHTLVTPIAVAAAAEPSPSALVMSELNFECRIRLMNKLLHT